jgi:hypothetical protein
MADYTDYQSVRQGFLKQRIGQYMEIIFQTEKPHHRYAVPSKKAQIKTGKYGIEPEYHKKNVEGAYIYQAYKGLFFLRAKKFSFFMNIPPRNFHTVFLL